MLRGVNFVVKLRRAAQQVDRPGLLVLQLPLESGDGQFTGGVLAAKLVAIGGHLRTAGLDGCEFLLAGLEFLLALFDLGFHRLAPAGRGGDLLAQFANPALEHFHALLTAEDLAADGGDAGLQLPAGPLQVHGLDLGAAAGRLQLVDHRRDGREGITGRVELLLAGGPLERQRVILGQEVQPAQLLELLAVALVAAGLAGLVLDGTKPLLDLGDNVVEAQEVLLDAFELAEGLLLAGLVLADAGGLVEDRPPVVLAGLEETLHAALLDDAVGVDAHAGVHEHLADVAQAAGRLVDEVFALAAAEQAAGDGHFLQAARRVAHLEQAAGVVEDQCHLGVPGGSPRGRAVEDDVHHLAAAEALGRLLAQHPLDGVHDVALAATVGPDDATDAIVEFELHAVGKALEAANDQLFEFHTKRFP